MNTLLVIANFISQTVTQEAKQPLDTLADKVLGNLTSIYLLSFVVAGFATLMMWLAYRSIRSERWIKYFAFCFGAIALNFLLKTFMTGAGFADVVSQHTLSIISNVFGVAAALEILNRRTLFDLKPRDLVAISNLKKWDYLLPTLCWTLAALSLIGILVAYPLHAPQHPYLQVVVDSPDYIFSALCVFLMGYAIFANLGVRYFRWWARLALLIASIYASLQIAFGLAPMQSYLFGINPNLLKAHMILIALPLKFFLFLFAYLLVVRFFEILGRLEQLQESEFKRRQDHLSSDGVVQWIGGRLSDKVLKNGVNVRAGEAPPKSGFVNLVVRLPGESDKRVACIVWPNYEEDTRPKILNWTPKEEKKFYPLSADVRREREFLESQRLHSGPPPRILTDVHYDREELLEWEMLLPFVNDVLTDDKRSEIVWVKDRHQSQAEAGDYNGNMRAVVSMAIQVNGAAIGCLQIARLDSHFSQMAIRQIRQIANMLSSAVQSYRELAGLDLMSIIFATEQLKEKSYSPEKAVELIINMLHDIFSATVTRLQIDFGFYTLQTTYRTKMDVGHVKENIEKEVSDKEWKDIPGKITSTLLPRPYKLLKKQLTARVKQTYVDKLRQEKDRFIMGNMLLAVDAEKDRYDQPALGPNYLHRKTASTLAAEAFLNFTSDYYSSILKRLGTALSARRLNFEEWFKPIQKILKEEAGFTWVVVRQRGRKECFGDEEGLFVLQRIKSLKRQVTTRRFNLKESLEIKTQYILNSPQPNCTNHILKLRLPSAEGFIWLGVQRPGFGPELEFSSPWKTFLVNFAQIADASLSRITIPEKFRAHVEAAQLQGIIASIATTGTMIHQFSNMIAGQMNSIMTLRDAIKLGELRTEDKDYEDILRAMNDSAASMLQIFQSFSSLASMDDHRPCRLIDAARHACKLFEVSLMPRGIKPQIEISEDIFIGVSFNVAALALANLVGNSKDAVEDGGMIRIDAIQQGDIVLCRVMDNGRGITPETQKNIFEPKSRTKEYGTGMGLYLTSHSLSEHESSIELTKSDETGSTFTLRFPSARKDITV